MTGDETNGVLRIELSVHYNGVLQGQRQCELRYPRAVENRCGHHHGLLSTQWHSIEELGRRQR